MGVSGTGKSTIGRLLSNRTGWDFYDADDFHPQTNIDKMNRGIPLTDRDRLPWLEKLHQLINKNLNNNQPGILACSALKSNYRQILSGDNPKVIFVYLHGDYKCIQSRIRSRTEHFMNSDLLKSQFDTLEEPKNAIVVNVALSPEAIAEQILNQIDY